MLKITKWLESKLPWLTAPTVVEVLEEVIPMPDIYNEECDVTVPNLTIVNDSTVDLDATVGFDPYDTAKFAKSLRK